MKAMSEIYADPQIGIVIIETPASYFGTVTSTTYGTFAGTTTLTTVSASGSASGTVVVGIPLSSSTFTYYVTSTRPYTGSEAVTQPTTVTTISPSGSQPGE